MIELRELDGKTDKGFFFKVVGMEARRGSFRLGIPH